jgi:parvulin-like peptidyl-prolyl isomerase
MNNWFVKHEKLISILIVSLFVIGIIWWSIGSYVSMNNGGNAAGQNQEITKESSVLVLTKDGEELDYPYWILESELNNHYESQLQQYEQAYQRSIDPVFDSLNLKTSLVNQLYDLKIIMYYSNENDLNPTDEEVENRINEEIESYISQLKSNESNWNQLMERYGSEKEVRDILRQSMNGMETQVMVEKVRDNVTNVSRGDILTEVENTFEDIKNEKEEVNAQHILISGEATANSVKDQLVSGELNFAQAAEMYSEDTSNASDAGNLGWFSHGDMVPEFEKAAFEASIGEIVGPIQTNYGYHLIKVNDKKTFETPEDVMNEETVVQEIKNKLTDEAFDNWLVEYKETENFGRAYYNDVLEYAYNFNNNTENVEVLENIRSNLQNEVFYDDGTVSIDSDTDYMALYINTSKALLNIYEERLTKVTQYISLKDRVEAPYLNMEIEAIEARIKEIDAELKAENIENEDALLDEKISLTDAKTYNNTLSVINELNLDSLEEAKEKKAELEDKVDTISENRTAVLEEMFYRYPSSNSVVQAYYQANPSDHNVKVAYSKLQIEQLKQYAGYLGAQNLASYFGNQIRDVVINISSVLSSKASTNTKLDAVEVGLDLSDLLEDDSLRLDYLKQLRNIDPNYFTDLEERIQELENTLNSTNTSTEE